MTAVNHWFVTVAFAAIGGLALVYPSCFTRIRPYFKQIRARGWAYDRVIAVAVRREQLENVPRAYAPEEIIPRAWVAAALRSCAGRQWRLPHRRLSSLQPAGE